MKKKLLAAVYLGVFYVFASHWVPFQNVQVHSASGENAFFPSHSAGYLPGVAAAIVELDTEPLVAHLTKATTHPELGRKISLESANAADYESGLIQEQEAFKAQAAIVSPTLKVRTQFQVVANAVSVEVPLADVAQIASLPGVKRVELAKQYRATLDSSVPLIGAPSLWERSGESPIGGQGIKIAIVDTGIDISNPLFFDSGFIAPESFPRGDKSLTNNKVIVAKSFLVDSRATPADEHGHGSNVAGIAAGRRGTVSPLAVLSGVAPEAYLGNYRVLDKNASGRSDLIARALEEALRDGFDVANLSFGAEAASELGFLDRAVEAAVAAGMVVVTSAGNNGQQGQMTINSPGISPSAITVGATTNAHFVTPVVAITGPQPVPPEFLVMEAVMGQGSQATVSNPIGPLPCVDVVSIEGQGSACAKSNGKFAFR